VKQRSKSFPTILPGPSSSSSKKRCFIERSHSRVAVEYADLKRQLAQQYRVDREAYTEAKGNFSPG